MGTMKEIAEGWANYVLNKQEEVSKLRMEICNACEHISTKHKTNRPDVHCINCGCTLAAKTRSLTSSCPLNKWQAIKKESNEKIHDKKNSPPDALKSSE